MRLDDLKPEAERDRDRVVGRSLREKERAEVDLWLGSIING
jgi:hypothetical protein